MTLDKSLEKKLLGYLSQLGLDREESLIFMFLLQNGPSTVLAISRGLKSGRTKLYPELKLLAEKQLINIHERHYGTSYEAQKPEVIEFLVSETERKANALRSSLPAALNLLQSIQNTSPSRTKIIEYRGVDGLKQMNFNLSKANKEFRVLELAGLDKHLGKHFAERNRARYDEAGLKSYDLTNNKNRSSESGIDQVNHLARYISPDVFKIEFETYIYNNVVGLLNYEIDDIFGVEIYSDKLARQQKSIFDLLWTQAKLL